MIPERKSDVAKIYLKLRGRFGLRGWWHGTGEEIVRGVILTPQTS